MQNRKKKKQIKQDEYFKHAITVTHQKWQKNNEKYVPVLQILTTYVYYENSAPRRVN